MPILPPDIRKALAFTLHDYELRSIERDDLDCSLVYLCSDDDGSGGPLEPHIKNLAHCIRRLLELGYTNAAVETAIILGEVLRDDEFDNSQESSFLERGKREAEAARNAVLRRWGPPEERRKMEEEIRQLCYQGVPAHKVKQALYEVARIMNERHPGCGVTARKVRRVITGH
jgi:hypothetical protein